MIKGLIVGALLCLSLMFGAPAKADVTELSRGVILVEDKIEVDDYRDFLLATRYTHVKHYDIILHTPGGNAYTVIGMMNRMLDLQARGVTFTTRVQGIAMSGGTYLFMMGDKRVVYEGAQLMFHGVIAQMKPYLRDILKKDHPKQWALLKRIDDFFLKLLIQRTGWTRSVADYWINGGTAQFMGAETAWATGLATQYIPMDRGGNDGHR